MIVEFKLDGYVSKVVFDCPGKPYKTIIVYSPQDYKYKGKEYSKDAILFETYKHRDIHEYPDTPDECAFERFIKSGISDDMNSFLHPHNNSPLTERLWKFFMTLLGFVPFHEPIRHASEYIPGPIFRSAEEVRNSRKTVVYHTFMEMQIPIALIKQMGTLAGIYDSICEFPDSVVFPPHLEPYVQPALIKLAMQKSPWITINDILVYDFLGFADVITSRKPVFINGDELIECNTANLLRAGYFSAEPGYNRLYFVYHPSKTDVGVPDTLLEMCGPYKAIKKIVEEWGDIGARTVRYVARQHPV